MRPWCLLEVCTTSMCSNTDHLEWHLDVYWRCVLRQCAATLITLNDILISIEGVYDVNVQQHWSPWMIPWCLLEVCTTSMCSNTYHLEWHLDVYWSCVLVNLQQHWSPWMRPWCLLEVCTTSMCSNTDHLEWYIDVYWRCVLRQCAATLITLNDILMSTGGCLLHQFAVTLMTLNDILMSTGGCVLQQCAATLITLNDTLKSIGGVYYVNVQQHWSLWMTSWCLMEVCTTSMSSNTDHLEWYLDVYWRCVLRQCAGTLITLNDILMSIEGV
jgi:metal-sulfur cluster biosynthetic enzyme